MKNIAAVLLNDFLGVMRYRNIVAAGHPSTSIAKVSDCVHMDARNFKPQRRTLLMIMRTLHNLSVFGLALSPSACGPPTMPERGAVAAAEPIASKAGADILRLVHEPNGRVRALE